MAKKITELPADIAVLATDVLPVVDVTNSVTKKATVSQIVALAGGGVPTPTKSLLYANGTALGAVPATYEGSGEIRAATNTYWSVINNAGTFNLGVWSRGNDSNGDYLTLGADRAWSTNSQFPVIYAVASSGIQLIGGFGTDYGSIFVAKPFSTNTGHGVGVGQNLALQSITNLGVLSLANTFGSGRVVVSLEYAVTEPTGNPTGCVLVWAKSADQRLYVRTATGAIYKVVGDTTTDTLTNKTIVASSNTITDTGSAAGDILVHDGTRFVRLAKGSNGLTLKMVAGMPAWA